MQIMKISDLSRATGVEVQTIRYYEEIGLMPGAVRTEGNQRRFGRGHVVDFIEYLKFPFMDFPVFNVADSCVVTAAILIALLGFLGIGLDGRRVQS